MLLIGSATHRKIDNIEWTQPFPDMEKYDSLIIDLNSFPRDYPPNLFTNIGLLKRTTRIFIRDNKEIFCIMSKPFRVQFKKIPLNFSWIPFPQRLRVNPMLLGRTIVLSDERFVSYMENVEKWENELFWEDTANCSFVSLAVNGTKNSIAATLRINNRGKIHFLPKATKISLSDAIDILIELARKEEPRDYPWLDSIEIPKLPQTGDLWNHVNPKEYRNLFSIDHKKVVKTVQLILEDLSIFTLPNTDFDLKGLKSRIVVKTVSTKGEFEVKNSEVSQLAKFVENPERSEKLIFIANTYKDLAIKDRASKKHIDLTMKLFFESNNVTFLTTLSLYNLWKKVMTYQISSQEASNLLLNQTGEIEI